MTHEESIRILESIQPSCGEKHSYTESEKYEALSLAISALSRDRWISVEERLPEEYGEYMILWKPKQPGVIPKWKLLYEIVEYEDGEWIGEIPQSEPFGGYEVFYWRELPAEPPKEET